MPRIRVNTRSSAAKLRTLTRPLSKGEEVRYPDSLHPARCLR